MLCISRSLFHAVALSTYTCMLVAEAWILRSTADVERQAGVHAAMMHSWEGYKKYAWGFDELMPKASHLLLVKHAQFVPREEYQSVSVLLALYHR